MASDHGVGPTPVELDAFATRPDQIRRRHGGTLSAALGGAGLLRSVRELTGTVEVESFSEYLLRVGWIQDRGGRLIVTPLGASIRRALDAESSSVDEVLHALIDPEDEYAYARVLSRIADVPDALVVDPYLKLEGLIDLRGLPNVRRILTSDERQKNLAKIGTFKAVQPRDELDLRYLKSHRMHDRYVIPPEGSALQLSTSLNSVGTRIGVVVTLDEVVTTAVRARHETMWDEAVLIERDYPTDPPATAGAISAD